jgi:hypothetical protein
LIVLSVPAPEIIIVAVPASAVPPKLTGAPNRYADATGTAAASAEWKVNAVINSISRVCTILPLLRRQRFIFGD